LSNRRLPLAAVVSTVIYIIAGCGGGGHNASGRASISILWPEPTRLIPKATNFVRVRALTSGGDPIGTLAPAVGRPGIGQQQTTTIHIDNLPVGATITFRAEAFSVNPDVTPSTPQARGQQAILIRNDAPNSFDISMASTVTQLAVFRGATEITTTLNLTAGEDAALNVVARDGAGSMVLVDPTNFRWSSGNTNLKLNFGSTVTGLTATARGQATIPTAAINLNESESSINRAVNVSVVEPT